MTSICIPTYEQRGKGAWYFAILLESIVGQVFADPYEILVSDNATDGSIKKVVDHFAARGVQIEYHFNPIRGASENINNAIELARYDKIKLMMQDDIFSHPMALRYFSDLLDKTGWVVSNSQHVNEIGRVTGQTIVNYDPANFDKNTIGMPSVVAFRRSSGVRFDPQLKTFCDLYFYYQLYQQYGQPSVIHNYMISQRYHNASQSRNQPPSHKKDKALLIRQGKIPGVPPRIVVAVVVYNRYDNIDQWLDVWHRCSTEGAKLVIIVNDNNTEPPPSAITFWPHHETKEVDNVQVITRKNIGYDIGAFQDVCRERLAGFPEYDYLLWCTDDTIPMDPDFINAFVEPFEKHIGLTCMQISREVTRHVRTTGFCIPKAVAKRLTFPADPITTVQQCWHFEHRGGYRTLLKQVEAMRLAVLQVAPLEKSPLYDKGFWYRNEQARKQAHLYDRMIEHYKIFPNLSEQKTA